MKNNNPLKIIQISDSHLFSNEAKQMLGVQTNVTYDAVLAMIKRQDISDTDCIFLTGDISQDESTESYELIANTLSTISIPIYWIPGNHDDLCRMTSVFGKYSNFHYTNSLSINNWNFVFLNTKFHGAEYGYLDKTEMNKLITELSKCSPDSNSVIVMHHHTHESNTPLIDEFILKNRDEFWNVVSAYDIKLIICGHVHGDYKLEKNGIIIESAPATCLQWEKGTKELRVDVRIGYKVYHFYDTHYSSISHLWHHREDG